MTPAQQEERDRLVREAKLRKQNRDLKLWVAMLIAGYPLLILAMKWVGIL